MAQTVLPTLTTRAALAVAIILLVACTEAALFVVAVPQPVRDILQVIVGVLIAKFGTVYDYYFGSSKIADLKGDPAA